MIKLTISWPGSGEPETSTTLSQFIADNADTIADDPQWIVDVVAALNAGGSYAGGGGAAAEYRLQSVEDEFQAERTDG